jgi:hypothetical protein
MSRLSVFWPDENYSTLATADEPMIIPFPNRRNLLEAAHRPMDVVTRARLMFANRNCHVCDYPVVEPIELADSSVNLGGLAIPGTATLIGFRCCGCKNEWSV